MPELVIGAQFANRGLPLPLQPRPTWAIDALSGGLGTTLATIAVLSTAAALAAVAGWLAVRIVLGGGAFDAQDSHNDSPGRRVRGLDPARKRGRAARRAVCHQETMIPTLASVASFIALFLRPRAWHR